MTSANPFRLKPEVANAVEVADAYLNDEGMPTFSAAIAVLIHLTQAAQAGKVGASAPALRNAIKLLDSFGGLRA